MKESTTPITPIHETSSETPSVDEPRGPPQACLFVARLSNTTTEDQLREIFSPYGTLLKIKLLKDNGSPYAFVQFADESDANQALKEAKGMTLHEGEAPLRVEKARVNRTLFIAKFPRQMDADQLRAQVEPYGEIESVSIIKNHVTGKSRGCGFVKFAFREDAALALQEIRDSQKRWVVEWAKSTNDPESLRLDKNCIFIGGLNSKEVTEDLLRERFQAYGELESVTLVYRESEVPEDEDKAPRSAFAFVRYDNIQSSENAIEAENGIEWLGQKIKVQYSESKEMKHRRRLKKYSAMYEPFPYYTMPVMYLPDGTQTNSYYPMYSYNPWGYQQMPMGVEGSNMMMPAWHGMPAWNQDEGAAPTVVPVIPWLP